MRRQHEPPAVDCVCGHSEHETALGNIIACLYYLNPPVVITNIGEDKAAPPTEPADG